MTNEAASSVLPSAVPIILFALLLFVLLTFAGIILLSLALRYRAGTARRQGRGWVTTMNVWTASFSAVFFVCFTLLLSFWLGPTLRFALTGMAIGGLLGLLGLILTRWESHPEGFFYTPSRWLALLVCWQSQHVLSTAGGTPCIAALPPVNIGLCRLPGPPFHLQG